MRLFKSKLFIGLILVSVFFSILFGTMSDYGINWDEPLHFSRGFAYFYYFLTGSKDFKGLPQDAPHAGNPHFPDISEATARYNNNLKNLSKDIRPSGYQYEGWTYEYWLKNDSGHPPLNDILAAATNFVFYRKLGIMDDLNSYHLFEILTGALMLGVVYSFAAKYYGIFAGIISSLSLFLYPLFFGEVHYNIKDPPEAAFFALTIFAFFEGVVGKSWRWILLSSIAAGFALGTKFNALFIPVVILPWLLSYLISVSNFKKYKPFLKKNKKFIISLVVLPIISFGIFYLTWPYLWQNPIHNILSVVGYYKQIGTASSVSPEYSFFGWNTYPFQWILYTTPPIVLFLSAIGVLMSIRLFKKDKNKMSFLLLAWFLIPILRVSIPGSSIYGGDRQIMELIPAMAMLCGLGAVGIRNFMAKRFGMPLPFSILLILAFVPAAITIVKLHPNEDVYFNSLVGGLAGAKEKNISGWGNSYGNVYLQGVNWMNKNSEQNSRLALVSGTLGNIPRPRLRTDIGLYNNYWSGPFRQGEYMMDMIYQGFPLDGYPYQYLETYLNPVYEKTVDGVAILKIWKNDAEHTKKGYLHEDQNVTVTSSEEGGGLKISLDKEVYLTKLDMYYDNNDCDPIKEGTVHISTDGKIWERLPDNIPTLQVTMDIEPTDRRLVYLFAAKKTKYILIYPDSANSCLFHPTTITVSKLTDITP